MLPTPIYPPPPPPPQAAGAEPTAPQSRSAGQPVAETPCPVCARPGSRACAGNFCSQHCSADTCRRHRRGGRCATCPGRATPECVGGTCRRCCPSTHCPAHQPRPRRQQENNAGNRQADRNRPTPPSRAAPVSPFDADENNNRRRGRQPPAQPARRPTAPAPSAAPQAGPRPPAPARREYGHHQGTVRPTSGPGHNNAARFAHPGVWGNQRPAVQGSSPAWTQAIQPAAPHLAAHFLGWDPGNGMGRGMWYPPYLLRAQPFVGY